MFLPALQVEREISQNMQLSWNSCLQIHPDVHVFCYRRLCDDPFYYVDDKVLNYDGNFWRSILLDELGISLGKYPLITSMSFSVSIFSVHCLFLFFLSLFSFCRKMFCDVMVYCITFGSHGT